MEDVLGAIVVAPGDKALDALQVIGVTLDVNGPCSSGPHVRTSVWLCQLHGSRPASLDCQTSHCFLRMSPLLEKHPGEERASGVEGGRGVGPEQHLLGGPEQEVRNGSAPHFFWQAQPFPATLP
jgi:hypothetical protein